MICGIECGTCPLALPVGNAVTTLLTRYERVSVTEGSLVETKEQLGSFYLIETSDLNETIRIASYIQVWSIREFYFK